MKATEISRRRFLGMGVSGVGAGGAFALLRETDAFAAGPGGVTFGVVADVHYADKPTRGTRFYRDSLRKMERCVEDLNRAGPAFAVVLGDLIDKAKDRATELGYIREVNAVLARFRGERHYVIGNHDVATLGKAEFLAASRGTGRSAKTGPAHYSFDAGGCHFVVLDANFRKDGTEYRAGNFDWRDSCIHEPQRRWLRADLAGARGRNMKTIVFVHQNLHDEKNPHGVKNAPETRAVLEGAGDVLAVIQGHDHAGSRAEIGGVRYLTLKAMVEGPAPGKTAYAVVHVDARHRIRVDGFGRQEDAAFPQASAVPQRRAARPAPLRSRRSPSS